MKAFFSSFVVHRYVLSCGPMPPSLYVRDIHIHQCHESRTMYVSKSKFAKELCSGPRDSRFDLSDFLIRILAAYVIPSTPNTGVNSRCDVLEMPSTVGSRGSYKLVIISGIDTRRIVTAYPLDLPDPKIK